MSSEFDKIWCVQYDQDSYHHTLETIKFKKYLNNILSNRYFYAFQKQAYMELNNQSEWNQRCWLLLQFFQYLNQAFDPVIFQKKLQFVPVRKLRQVYGCFRMWIDLQRLYLLLFLKLDRIQFQQDRIFFCLYRTFNFFYELLTQYHTQQFDRSYIVSIGKEVKKHCTLLSSILPKYFSNTITLISQMINQYSKGEAISGFDTDKQQIKKYAYQKLIRLYDMMPQIEERLKQNVGFLNKFREMDEIIRIVDDPQIKSKAETIKKIYDPKLRIVMDFKQKSKAQNIPFDEGKLNELLKQYEEREKIEQKKNIQNNYYQNIFKSGHNPYDQSNYAIYGETLKVDMNDKADLQIQQLSGEEDQEEKTINRNQIYEQSFLQKAEKMTTASAQVTNKDLLLNVDNLNKKRNNLIPNKKDKNNLSDMKWKKYKDEEEKKKLQDDMMALTTLQTLNRQKNLDNNALFFEDQDRDQMKMKIMNVKIMSQNGIKSNAIYGMEKHALKVYEIDKTKLYYNINKKCTMDRNTFDSLRKVLQLASIQKKIDKWINIKNIPKFYPRNIDQIRQWPCNPLKMQLKRQAALRQIEILDSQQL